MPSCDHELQKDIIGCLDYCLRHSSWFSGYTEDGIVRFTSDKGESCKLKFGFNISNISPPNPDDYAKTLECSMDEFKTVMQRYVDGDPHVYPADDPAELRMGFFTDDPGQTTKYYCQSLSKIKKLYSEVWHKCVAKKIDDSN